ncbi:Nitrogen fixation regulation protein FixK [Aquimixticola soesokkakensis]|uniref:Nitrogen fixation regulation protein FixK n=1 Tax=Aquimixticola soesokkakensis TaxID=1519096 RepID=A0A1Y5T769_9RHOB|nr:Crp/Fnr family transcriptional regulator [Aquimixticola soesokkakensis]SLN57367.1 Nitrogen fixation regulation protein FixK [Aquimixticola soesokkakensis]
MRHTEVADLDRFKTGEMTIRPGRPFMHEGVGQGGLFRLQSGMGLQSVNLPDGRRQVTCMLVPDDVIGIEDGFLDTVSRTAEATTELRLSVYDKRGFLTHLCENPKRATTLVRLLSLSERRATDQMVTLGQRGAAESICWAVYRFYRRLDAISMTHPFGEGGVSFPFPYRQRDLADALGLSLVHTNKTLARLRDLDLVHWRGDRIEVAAVTRLRTHAGIPDREDDAFD